jgi:hypothetical protein
MSKLFRDMSEEVTASSFTIGFLSDKNIIIKSLHKIEKIILN